MKADIKKGVLILTPETGAEEYGLEKWLDAATSKIVRESEVEMQQTYLKGTALKVVKINDNSSNPAR